MSDPYTIAETALATLIRTLGPTYFPGDKQRDAGWQVADDDTVLALGGEYFVIYRPGAFPITTIARGIKDYNWNVSTDIFVRYVSYKESWNKFKAFRAAIITLLDTHQALDGASSVHGVGVSSSQSPLFFRFTDSAPGSKPNFIVQTMQVVLIQRVLYTSGDL